MNENRSIFSIDGITGMLIATVLLLTILVGLIAWSMNVQTSSAANFYDIKDEASIKMVGSTQADHVIDVKK